MPHVYCIKICLIACFFSAFLSAAQADNFNKERTFMNKTENKHPQEPIAPFAYNSEDVIYRNETADITLAGTLTTPKSKSRFPAVILIAGMGPVNRDGMMYGHKLYLVLADYLTKLGIAVLRYDKRGVGASGGTLSAETTSRDLADDVLAGIIYLKTRHDINPQNIGLIGVSEGGFIASLLAGESADVAFAVSMAGAVANDPALLAEQTATQLRADGASQDLINAMRALMNAIYADIKYQQPLSETTHIILQKVQAFLNALPQEVQDEAAQYPFAVSTHNAAAKINYLNSPWYRWLLTQDMQAILRRISVPYLALYGERDFMAPHIMLPFIEQALKEGTNDDWTLLAVPNLNHAFQTCTTGALAEYATTEETIAPYALEIIGNWIKKHI